MKLSKFRRFYKLKSMTLEGRFQIITTPNATFKLDTISGESWKFNPGPLDWDFITEDNAGRAIAHNQAFKDSIRGIAERAFKKQLINLGKSTKHTGRLLSLLDALQDNEHPLITMMREIEEPFSLFEAEEKGEELEQA